MKPESIKTKNPVFFIDGVPLHRLGKIQDGQGNFIGQTRTLGLHAIAMGLSFLKAVVPKGLTRFADGSHRYSTWTKGYEFDPKNPNKKPPLANLQLAVDIRVPKKNSVVTSNFDMKCLKDGVGLGNGSYTLVGSGVWQVYLVHQYGYPKTGETVKAGNPLSLTIAMNGYHLHIYCLKNGKQFDMETLILEAGAEYDKAEAELNNPPVPPTDPCARVKKENERLVKEIKTVRELVEDKEEFIGVLETTIEDQQIEITTLLTEQDELERRLEECEAHNHPEPPSSPPLARLVDILEQVLKKLGLLDEKK